MNVDLISIGEILMDLTSVSGESFRGYVANEGGAPLNVAIMAARTGIKCGFVGKVGSDVFGERLIQLLKKEKVNTERVFIDPIHPTTLAMVTLMADGERKFNFYREGTADYYLYENEMDIPSLSYKGLYFGGVGLSKSPLRESVLSLVKHAKNQGKTIFFDPNYRPALWEDDALAVKYMKEACANTDVIKVSESEAFLISGENNIISSINQLHSMGIKLVYLTRGEEGAILSYNKRVEEIEALEKINPIDTTGAGDAFFGTVIGQLLKLNREWDFLDVLDAGQSGAIAGGLCTEKYGAISSYPDFKSILDFKGKLG